MAMNRTRTWLLIADASRAEVFENAGDRDAFAEIEDLSLSTELPMTRELLEDKPGRTFESVGSGRHAKEEPTDPRRRLKREFAGTVIDALRDAMLARRFDRLVLIAPPAFLGDLRAKLPKIWRTRWYMRSLWILQSCRRESFVSGFPIFLSKGAEGLAPANDFRQNVLDRCGTDAEFRKSWRF